MSTPVHDDVTLTPTTGASTPTTSTAEDTMDDTTDPTRTQEPGGPAIGTLAWGLVTLAVAGVLLLREVTDVTVDLTYALPVGMVSLGALLVVGAVLTALRRR